MKIITDHGYRASSFLDLPYVGVDEPIRCLSELGVVEVMHNIFTGLPKTQFQVDTHLLLSGSVTLSCNIKARIARKCTRENTTGIHFLETRYKSRTVRPSTSFCIVSFSKMIANWWLSSKTSPVFMLVLNTPIQ